MLAAATVTGRVGRLRAIQAATGVARRSEQLAARLTVPVRERLRGPIERMRAIPTGWWVAGLTIAFIAITFWWLMADGQVPDFDEGPHIQLAFVVRSEILSGHWSAIFTDFNSYPPLGHFVGAIGTLIGGLSVTSVIFAGNLVFVPLLIGGCYGAGKIAYGPRAGLLAALFALCAPMISSEFHEFYLDPLETAMVAISVWALLASRRFERVGYSALAGLLCALGVLTKQTFVLFVGGLIAVMFLRGGWRNWKGLLAFVGVGALLGLPWYIDHISQLSGLASGYTTPGSPGTAAGPGSIAPSRFSAANVFWYLWDLLNRVLLTPLTLLFLAGTGVALWRFTRRRASDDLTPELVGGGLVGYLGITYITLRDPRYALPVLVYMAVLGTCWIATARPALRRWMTAAFAAVVVINFVSVNFGGGPSLQLRLPGGSSLPTLDNSRRLTFFSPAGWRDGAPVGDGDLLNV
ncbi:MAG: ArnT family glycosyltransferase, partial [Solirubrobacteraceae bacterium]